MAMLAQRRTGISPVFGRGGSFTEEQVTHSRQALFLQFVRPVTEDGLYILHIHADDTLLRDGSAYWGVLFAGCRVVRDVAGGCTAYVEGKPYEPGEVIVGS